jgi:hypothetical protein
VLSVTADDENEPSLRFGQVDVLIVEVCMFPSVSVHPGAVRCSTTAGSIYDTILFIFVGRAMY